MSIKKRSLMYTTKCVLSFSWGVSSSEFIWSRYAFLLFYDIKYIIKCSTIECGTLAKWDYRGCQGHKTSSWWCLSYWLLLIIIPYITSCLEIWEHANTTLVPWVGVVLLTAEDDQVYILYITFGHKVLGDIEGVTVLVRLGNKMNIF